MMTKESPSAVDHEEAEDSEALPPPTPQPSWAAYGLTRKIVQEKVVLEEPEVQYS